MRDERDAAGIGDAPIDVEGPRGPVRLKWHKLRTSLQQAPFKLSNLLLGWKLGASLEVDVLAAGDGRFMVLHDATLGPSTTGRGRVASMTGEEMAGHFHRDGYGEADPDAPVLSFAELMTHLRQAPRAPSSNLQIDLKVLDSRPPTEASVGEAAAAVAGLEGAIVVGSHYLDQARRLADAMPGARLGYDPMLAASRDRELGQRPERLLRHMERRKVGVTLAYLRFDVVVAMEMQGFPLVGRLLDLGIETDAWTINPGPSTTRSMLRTLAEAGVRQITTDAPAEMASQVGRAFQHGE